MTSSTTSTSSNRYDQWKSWVATMVANGSTGVEIASALHDECVPLQTAQELLSLYGFSSVVNVRKNTLHVSNRPIRPSFRPPVAPDIENMPAVEWF